MSDYLKPKVTGIRNPNSTQQQNGSIINPPVFSQFGGFTNAGKIGAKNKMTVEKTPSTGKKVI